MSRRSTLTIAAQSPPSNSLSNRRSLQADTLAASVVILLVATAVQRTIGFGRGVMFCRWLSPETLGQWEMTYSFLMLAAPLAVLGVPGSFGRYAEHYRQRGHLRTFLHRAAAWTTVCTVVSIGLIEWFAVDLSQLLFGRPDSAALVRGIGVCLVTVIMQHTLTALLTALRLYRIVSALNFVQSLLFAAISLGFMWGQPTMWSIVVGYTAASLVASVGAVVWAWPALRQLDPPADELGHSEFWTKLLRFAFFVWLTNLLTNLFAVIDRYMLVHCAGLSAAQALDQVGHYHSSRVIPLLLVSVAELLGGLVMPHLTHDWEAGQHAHVSSRLNLAIKLTSAAMLVCGVCILAAAPFLFHVVLQGRYNEGLAVLPWTLAGCVWYGIYCIAQNYLWCAEKTRLATTPLIFGLLLNIALNFALLPAYGLHGAVLATGISTGLCLATVMALSWKHGLALDGGTWLLAASPVALGFGLWPSVAMCAVLAAAAVAGDLVLTPAERLDLKLCLSDTLDTLLAPFGWRQPRGQLS